MILLGFLNFPRKLSWNGDLNTVRSPKSPNQTKPTNQYQTKQTSINPNWQWQWQLLHFNDFEYSCNLTFTTMSFLYKNSLHSSTAHAAPEVSKWLQYIAQWMTWHWQNWGVFLTSHSINKWSRKKKTLKFWVHTIPHRNKVGVGRHHHHEFNQHKSHRWNTWSQEGIWAISRDPCPLPGIWAISRDTPLPSAKKLG